MVKPSLLPSPPERSENKPDARVFLYHAAPADGVLLSMVFAAQGNDVQLDVVASGATSADVGRVRRSPSAHDARGTRHLFAEGQVFAPLGLRIHHACIVPWQAGIMQ